ncbi:T9SS type A sorting domain-containing protein [Algoriphagus sp. AGSA1]|uniref:T9SS type A sorting domain-containing protein n=1 Tax=Algoriphagus sp. AGSA1 TaxID=2907213 RepID=UPI001F2341D1|nr:T9SS type A sorting domain-containing protein [Algoriphagus sp. AGSA1]MCE7053259.1 T9SS type A sorting domain-containing protein [Algoriphagus sp. AGSA1]
MEDSCGTYKAGPGCGLFAGFLCLVFLKPTGKPFSVRIVLLCLILFVGAFGQVWGQTTRVYASSSEAQLCVICAINISNPGNAGGSNLQNYAHVDLPLALGTRYLELRFTNAIPAGTTIRIKVGYAPGLAGLLNNINIRAYRNTTSVSPQYPANDLLSVLGGDNVQEIVLTPEITGPDFNRIRINFSSLLSLGGYFRVYAAYYLSTAGSISCGGVKDVIYGSTATLVGGLNPVINAPNAIDGNVNTFAQLNSNVSLVTDKTHVTALFDDLSRAGDSIRVILKNPSGLLNANLISQNLAITTYNNLGVAQSLALNPSFLRLRLLDGGEGRYELTYPTTVPFNRIEVSLGQGLLSALNSLEVYEISRTLVSSSVVESDGKSLTICEGEELTFEPSVVEPGDRFFWYDEDGILLEGNASDYTIPTNLSPRIHQFRLGTQRLGCTNQTSLSTIQVEVNPQPKEEDILIDSQGGVLEENNQIVYPAGSDVVLDPNNSQLPPGVFSWYRNALGDPLNGVVVDGGTFSVDPITQTLTISNTTDALLEESIFLGYETASGCKEVKEFELLNYIILPIQIHKFEAEARESRQVNLRWELSNEQRQGTVTVQRASANLEFVDLDNLSIVSGEERVPMNFTDFNPLPGRNYYRLLIGKENGDSGFYSDVRMAEVGEFEGVAFTVFPSPFESSFTVISTVDLDTSVTASLMNTSGAVIRQVQMGSLSYGERIEFRELGDLPAGIYILRIETGRGSRSYRVIKQNDG